MKSENPIQVKSFQFAVKSVYIYKFLISSKQPPLEVVALF